MPKEKLRKLLGEIREELEDTDSVEAEDRDLLRGLTADIERALAADPAGPDTSEASLLDRMNESIERFEGSYPTLSAMLGRVLDQLAKLGI